MKTEYINNERLLIAELKDEKTSAIRYVYQKYFPGIQKYIYNNSGLAADAKDVFQDTLVAAIKNIKLGKYKQDGKFGAYLKVIARNIWINQIRNKKEISLDQIQEAGGKFEDVVEIENNDNLSERQALLVKKFNLLKEDCQNILKAFYYRNASMTEIAEEFNYTSSFVRVKKNRCMNYLKNLVLK